MTESSIRGHIFWGFYALTSNYGKILTVHTKSLELLEFLKITLRMEVGLDINRFGSTNASDRLLPQDFFSLSLVAPGLNSHWNIAELTVIDPSGKS